MPHLLDRIGYNDFNVLANNDLFTQRLAVKSHDDGHLELTSISNNEVTAWQLFLRAVGRGKLAKQDPYLTSVTSYLNQFNWSQANPSDPAYVKACQLANKALYSKGDTALFNNVASTTVDKKMEFSDYYSHTVTRTFRLNPYVQVRHIQALVKQQYPWSSRAINTMQIKDEHGREMDSNEFVTPEILEKMHIRINHHYFGPRVILVRPSQEQATTSTQTGYATTKRR